MEFAAHLTDDIPLDELQLMVTEEVAEPAPKKSRLGMVLGGLFVGGGFAIGAAAAIAVLAVGTVAAFFIF